jgi:LysR family glycine cleavage system transcriptional activator
MLRHWPPLNALRGFEAAARLGSFHRAAEELHLTQSAISQQIRGLEASLQQPLFFRQAAASPSPMPASTCWKQRRRCCGSWPAASAGLDQYRKPNQLIVNTSPAFARHWLVPRLASFHRLHPDADLWLLTSEEAPDMTTQTLDVAVRDTSTHRRSASIACCCRTALSGLPSGPARHAGARTPHPAWRARDGLEPVAGRAAPMSASAARHEFLRARQLLDAACQGLGIALVSELLAARACEQGLLQPRMMHACAARAGVGWYTRTVQPIRW